MEKQEIIIVPKKKTKIMATIGPVSNNEETIKSLVEKGVDAFRLNLSHSNREYHHNLIKLIRKITPNIPIFMDTKGSEIRIGELKEPIEIKEGSIFTLTIENVDYEETKKIKVSYPDFINDVEEGDIIIIDSGKIKAKIIQKTSKDIKCQVLIGSEKLRSKRHINLQGKKVSLPSITKDDWDDYDFCIKEKVDFIALSFIRDSSDFLKVREYFDKKGYKEIQIIAKIESYESTLNYEEIIKISDGIAIARGDLACEISFSQLPFLQKKIVETCHKYNKPVNLATQIISSMCENIQPTRAECNDIGNSVFDGIDSLTVCEETAEGKYPILTIETMSNIINYSEENFYKNSKPKSVQCWCNLDFILGLSDSNLNTNFIVLLQNRNDFIAKKFASCKLYNFLIFAFTNNEILYRQMNFLWGIIPIYNKMITNSINNDNKDNIKLIEESLKTMNVKNYILVYDNMENDNSLFTIQLRYIN